MFELDLMHTLAFAGVALLGGHFLLRGVPILARYNLPAPVLGGLIVAVAVLIAHGQGVTLVKFDTTLQNPLMIAFFTTIGFGASLSLLKIGGPQVLRFFLLATVFAVVQNFVGILVALGFGLDPLFGVLAGSVTLTGVRRPVSPSRHSSRRPASSAHPRSRWRSRSAASSPAA